MAAASAGRAVADQQYTPQGANPHMPEGPLLDCTHQPARRVTWTGRGNGYLPLEGKASSARRTTSASDTRSFRAALLIVIRCFLKTRGLMTVGFSFSIYAEYRATCDVLQHLTEIAQIDRRAAVRARQEMLGLVLGRLFETLADVLAARRFDHAIGNDTLDMLPSE
jgi:hypothetical protein